VAAPPAARFARGAARAGWRRGRVGYPLGQRRSQLSADPLGSHEGISLSKRRVGFLGRRLSAAGSPWPAAAQRPAPRVGGVREPSARSTRRRASRLASRGRHRLTGAYGARRSAGPVLCPRAVRRGQRGPAAWAGLFTSRSVARLSSPACTLRVVAHGGCLTRRLQLTARVGGVPGGHRPPPGPGRACRRRPRDTRAVHGGRQLNR
jgi:hypothetical protein